MLIYFIPLVRANIKYLLSELKYSIVFVVQMVAIGQEKSLVTVDT